MLESLGTEIRPSVMSGYYFSYFTFQLYRPAGIRGRRRVGEGELHTAGVLIAVGVPCLVLHTQAQHAQHAQDTEDRLTGDHGGKYCCTAQTGLAVHQSSLYCHSHILQVNCNTVTL